MSDRKRVSEPDCPLKLEVCYQACYFWRDGKCDYDRVMGSEAHSERRYCPVCKEKIIFICQAGECFCSKCGYREKERGEGDDY